MTNAEALLAAQADVAFGTPGAWVQVAALDRTSGELVGDCAVHVLADQPGTAEVDVTLAPGRQGAGLAAEALGPIVSTLVDDHHLHRVFAQADDRNTGVRRLLERLGFRCRAQGRHRADALHRVRGRRALAPLLYRVLGGETVMAGEPTIVALANGWVIINVGGGPTDDKPTVTLETPRDPDRVSSFLNIRVPTSRGSMTSGPRAAPSS